MSAEFFAKLQTRTRLAADELAALGEICGPVERAGANTMLVEEGRRQSRGVLLTDGWAIRYRLLADGRRQIVGFVLPGDLCDPTFFVADTANHSVMTITPATLRLVGGLDLLNLIEARPRIGVAFWWLAAHEKALLQEQLVSTGRMTAYERAAYTLWELWRRLTLAGQTVGETFRFPVTQAVLADSLGLSAVHTNRVLQQLRRDGLIRLHTGSLSVLDAERLEAAGQSGDEYLLLGHPGDGPAIH